MAVAPGPRVLSWKQTWHRQIATGPEYTENRSGKVRINARFISMPTTSGIHRAWFAKPKIELHEDSPPV
jgi:hypothetical protein